MTSLFSDRISSSNCYCKSSTSCISNGTFSQWKHSPFIDVIRSNTLFSGIHESNIIIISMISSRILVSLQLLVCGLFVCLFLVCCNLGKITFYGWTWIEILMETCIVLCFVQKALRCNIGKFLALTQESESTAKFVLKKPKHQIIVNWKGIVNNLSLVYTGNI